MISKKLNELLIINDNFKQKILKEILTPKNKISTKKIYAVVKKLKEEEFFLSFFKKNKINIDDFKDDILFFIWFLDICPYCKTCNKPINSFKDHSYYLRDYCSIGCRNKNKDLIKKTKETFIKKYGVESYTETEDFKEKQKNFLKNEKKKKERHEKIKKTLLQKYGVDNPMKIDDFKEKANQTFKKNYLKKKNLYLINLEKDFEKGFNYIKEKYNWKTDWTVRKWLKKFNIKDFCKSKIEEDLKNFIKTIYSGEIIENSRKIIKPKELDIYIPEKNLAIEFDGLYWHSEGLNNYKNDIKNYHLEKTKACEEKNINLLHIFENEWLDPIKQDIWKSIISYKLGNVKQRYFARKLEFKEIDNKEAREFLELNHIQGNVSSKIKLGLYNKDKLISLMTFSKPRFNKNYEYELIRFASLKYSSCVGCAQKLLKYFLKTYQPKNIISYANRRFASSLSNVYQKLGFRFLRETESNYYYFSLKDPMMLYHRSHFQKYKLKNYKETKDQFDSSLTESKIMFNSGYRRIYDSGNLVYHLEVK